MLTSELINVLLKSGYRLTALDTGQDTMARFILGVKLDEPIDAWYIAQTLASTNAAVVPQFSEDMKTLGFMNVALNEKDFESILAVY